MSINYPSSADSFNNPAGTTLVTDGTALHNVQHSNANDAIEALEAKIGVGAGTPTVNKVLVGSGNGTSVWGTVVNDLNLGTPIITGGTINSITGTLNNSVLGTPTVVVGSDATYDMYYRGASGTLTRIPVGTTGQFLSVSGGTPSFVTSSPTQINSGAYVTMTAYQTISASATTQVNYDSEVYDLGSEYNASSKYFIAGTSGIYNIVSSILLNANIETNVQYSLYIYINGTIKTRAGFTFGNAVIYPTWQCTWMGSLVAGNTVDVRFSNIGTGNVQIGFGQPYNYFSVQRIY